MNRISLIALLLLFLASSCAQDTEYENLSSFEFQRKLTTTPGTLLDVRTPSEYANGHITSAGQLNYYAPDFQQRLLLLPKNQPVYLYCNTGWRSKRAAQILSANGYQQVYNLKNGIMEWNLKDLPVIVEPNAESDEANKMKPDEFYALIQSQELVFIDFYAPWCAPCQQMMPMIDSLTTEYNSKITFVKINVDASKKLVKELEMKNVPFLVLYHKGKRVFSHAGVASRQQLNLQFNTFL